MFHLLSLSMMTQGVLGINQNLGAFGKCRKTWAFRTFSLNIFKCTLMLRHHYLVYPLEFSFVDEVLLLITWNFHLFIFSNGEYINWNHSLILQKTVAALVEDQGMQSLSSCSTNKDFNWEEWKKDLSNWTDINQLLYGRKHIMAIRYVKKTQ